MKIMSCRFIRSVSDLFNHQYGICRMYSEEDPQDFRLPVPGLYSCKWVMLLLSTEAAFKPGGSFFWEFTSEYLPQGLIFGRPSLAHKGGGYSTFRTELSIGHYWRIWNLQSHILPLHSWVSAADVYPHWMPWTRCTQWTICHLSVYC